MALRSVVCSFKDVNKLLEVIVICAKLPIGLAKLVESEGCIVLLVWVTKMSLEGCEAGGEAINEEIKDLLTAVLRGFAEVDLHRSLCLTC